MRVLSELDCLPWSKLIYELVVHWPFCKVDHSRQRVDRKGRFTTATCEMRIREYLITCHLVVQWDSIFCHACMEILFEQRLGVPMPSSAHYAGKILCAPLTREAFLLARCAKAGFRCFQTVRILKSGFSIQAWRIRIWFWTSIQIPTNSLHKIQN